MCTCAYLPTSISQTVQLQRLPQCIFKFDAQVTDKDEERHRWTINVTAGHSGILFVVRSRWTLRRAFV